MMYTSTYQQIPLEIGALELEAKMKHRDPGLPGFKETFDSIYVCFCDGRFHVVKEGPCADRTGQSMLWKYAPIRKGASSMFTEAACARIRLKAGMYAHMQACMFKLHLLHQIIPLHFMQCIGISTFWIFWVCNGVQPKKQQY